MLDWNLVVWRRRGGGGGWWWWWWWWCQVFDAKNSATHYPCLFSSVALEEEEEGEVKLLMPKFWKKIKLSYYPFLLFLLIFLSISCANSIEPRKDSPPTIFCILLKNFVKKNWIFLFQFQVRSPNLKDTHTHRLQFLSKVCGKKFLSLEEFKTVQICSFWEREREREKHTHTHKHRKFLFRFWSNVGSSSEEHGE